MRENLDSFITRLALKETPVRDRLPRKTGSGLAASWNVMTALGVGTSAFAEGARPTEDATTYVRRSALYQELGKVKSITDKMIAAGKSFLDIESELTEVAIREVIQDEEQFIITGDSGVNANVFDGLKTQITTNIINDANNALGFRTNLIQTAVAELMRKYAVRPTAIYVGYGMKKAISESLMASVKVNLDQGNRVSTGLQVESIATMAGDLPFVTTFAIGSDSTTYAGYTVEDIYIVTEKAQGQDVIYMEDMEGYSLGKSNLDRTGAAINFMVTQATVLVNRAQEFHYRLRNVRVG